jgi:hypothetical protein
MLIRRILTTLTLAGLLALAGCSLPEDATNQPAGDDNAPATSSKAKAQGKPAGTVLLSLKGSGTKTTKKFSAAGDWDLRWSYDCSGFGTKGNFIVQPQAADALSEVAMLTPVNQLGDKGSGVEHYHAGGNGIWLEINSECSWSVKAVAA